MAAAQYLSCSHMSSAQTIATVLALALVAASAISWLILGRKLRGGTRIRVNSQPRAAVRTLTVVLSLLASIFAVAAFADMLKGQTDHPLEIVIIASVAHFFTFVAVMALVTRDGTYEQLGITFGSFGRQASEGSIAFVLSVVPVAAAMLLIVQPLRTDENAHDFLKKITENPSFETVGLVVLAAVILAPLVEELIFRVILQGSLQRVLRPQQAILIVAVMFSMVHGFPDMFAIFPLALILGFTFFITHRYWTVVITHALFNAANIALQFLSVE